jgi:hypothetical protein
MIYCPAGKGALRMPKLIANYIPNVCDVPNVYNFIESTRRLTNLKTHIIYYYMKFA